MRIPDVLSCTFQRFGNASHDEWLPRNDIPAVSSTALKPYPSLHAGFLLKKKWIILSQ